MKVLVCIGNNLKYDTRVKRHINAIKNRGHEIHVVACPVPTDEWGMDNNISHSFSKYVPTEAPINDVILEFAHKYGLRESFLYSFPIFKSYRYYNPIEMKIYTKELNRYIAGDRWKEIRTRVDEKMDKIPAMSYPLIFFDRAVQFAKKALEFPADVVLCNDEDTLLAGVVHKKKYGSRLIYDFHDLMADISDGVFPQIYSNVLALFEKQMIQYADIVMSVSKAELIWSKRHYGFSAPMVPMLNCSKIGIALDAYDEKKYDKKKIRIYYHGMSDTSRGLVELIEAVRDYPQFDIIIRGLPSDDLENIKAKVREENREEQICFLEPVGSDKVVEAAYKEGDIGFSFCHTEKCINWRCALTNKFIEYTKAGLPIITSPTEEQGEIVNNYKTGWILEENSVDGIRKVLKKILDEREMLSEMSQRALQVGKKVFDWEYYENSLEAVVSDNISEIEKRKIPFEDNKIELAMWEIEDKKNRRSSIWKLLKR